MDGIEDCADSEGQSGSSLPGKASDQQFDQKGNRLFAIQNGRAVNQIAIMNHRTFYKIFPQLSRIGASNPPGKTGVQRKRPSAEIRRTILRKLITRTHK